MMLHIHPSIHTLVWYMMVSMQVSFGFSISNCQAATVVPFQFLARLGTCMAVVRQVERCTNPCKVRRTMLRRNITLVRVDVPSIITSWFHQVFFVCYQACGDQTPLLAPYILPLLGYLLSFGLYL